jgi:hypothetical protein
MSTKVTAAIAEIQLLQRTAVIERAQSCTVDDKRAESLCKTRHPNVRTDGLIERVVSDSLISSAEPTLLRPWHSRTNRCQASKSSMMNHMTTPFSSDQMRPLVSSGSA